MTGELRSVRIQTLFLPRLSPVCSTFQDIYDIKHFLVSLKEVVDVVEILPERMTKLPIKELRPPEDGNATLTW